MKKLISLAMAVALVCCFCTASIYAKGDLEPKEPLAAKPTEPTEKAKPNEKLKADMAKLVADAKAGKLKMPAQQFPQPKKNNLSKGVKIAIGAGIAGAVIFIILWYTTGPGSD